MLRMNFISLPVTNSADGGRRSYPKLSKWNKTAGFRPIPRWGAAAALDVSAPPSGNAAPSSGCPLAPPLLEHLTSNCGRKSNFNLCTGWCLMTIRRVIGSMSEWLLRVQLSARLVIYCWPGVSGPSRRLENACQKDRGKQKVLPTCRPAFIKHTATTLP